MTKTEVRMRNDSVMVLLYGLAAAVIVAIGAVRRFTTTFTADGIAWTLAAPATTAEASVPDSVVVQGTTEHLTVLASIRLQRDTEGLV